MAIDVTPLSAIYHDIISQNATSTNVCFLNAIFFTESEPPWAGGVRIAGGQRVTIYVVGGVLGLDQRDQIRYIIDDDW